MDIPVGARTPWKVHYRVANGYTGANDFKVMRNMSDENLVELDATGLECPMPLLKAKRALNTMKSGQRLRVLATDSGSVRDFQVFSEQSGHRLLSSEEAGGVYIHVLQKR